MLVNCYMCWWVVKVALACTRSRTFNFKLKSLQASPMKSAARLGRVRFINHLGSPGINECDNGRVYKIGHSMKCETSIGSQGLRTLRREGCHLGIDNAWAYLIAIGYSWTKTTPLIRRWRTTRVLYQTYLWARFGLSCKYGYLSSLFRRGIQNRSRLTWKWVTTVELRRRELILHQVAHCFSTVENTTGIAGPCECSKTGCTANNGRVILAILAIAIKVQKWPSQKTRISRIAQRSYRNGDKLMYSKYIPRVQHKFLMS